MLRVSHLCSLTLLFCTLLLSSCIAIDKTLGGNLIPTDQDLTIATATFDLPIDSRLSDSLQSNNHFFIYDSGAPYLFGACYDPIFGLTQAGAVFQFYPYNLYGSGISLGDNPEPLSLTITWVKQQSIVLDQSQLTVPQNIFLHEVTTEITYKSAYNNSLEPQDWNPVPISQPGQLYFGGDTIRLSLSLDYAKELLSATQEERDSSALFSQRFKGLYLRAESPEWVANAGRLTFAGSPSMVLRYKTDGSESDSTLYFYIGAGYEFNSIVHSNASIDPHPSEHIYYQGFAGYKPYVDFVALIQNITTWAELSQIDVKKLLISSAQMVLSYDGAIDYTVINQYPASLYPYTRKFTDTTSYYVPIDNFYASNSDGAINRSKYLYSMNITSYLQSLLKKDEVTEQDNTWLMESTYYADETTGATYYFYNKYSYPLATYKGLATDAKPKLIITYSVLK